MGRAAEVDAAIWAEVAAALRPRVTRKRRRNVGRRRLAPLKVGRKPLPEALRWLVAQLGERRLATVALASESWRRLAARSTVAAVDGGRVVRRRAKPRTFRRDAWGRLAKAAARR